MTLKIQDPSDNLDWTHDWSDFLADGDTVSTRLWTINPDSSPSLLTDETAASVKVAELTAGVVYRLAEKIVTTGGVTGERSLTIRCEDV